MKGPGYPSFLEISGFDASPETNFCHQAVFDLHGALALAERAGFPEHGLIVIASIDGQPDPEVALIKDVCDHSLLEQAVQSALARCGAVFVESEPIRGWVISAIPERTRSQAYPSDRDHQ
jgi:hypothetical protein